MDKGKRSLACINDLGSEAEAIEFCLPVDGCPLRDDRWGECALGSCADRFGDQDVSQIAPLHSSDPMMGRSQNRSRREARDREGYLPTDKSARKALDANPPNREVH
jgi:hypothetical protein